MRQIVVIVVLFTILPGLVHARTQRCMLGSLTEKTLKGYPVILVGKVMERTESNEMGGGFALTDWGKNIVHVIKSWKGPAKGERIAVHRNERWGDGLSEDTGYLIFAKRDDDDDPDSPLIAPVCSHTRPLSEAGRLVKGLEKYFSRQSQKGVQLMPGPTGAQ